MLAVVSAGCRRQAAPVSGRVSNIQFTSPVVGRYGLYIAVVALGMVAGESREITIASPDLCGRMGELYSYLVDVWCAR